MHLPSLLSVASILLFANGASFNAPQDEVSTIYARLEGQLNQEVTMCLEKECSDFKCELSALSKYPWEEGRGLWLWLKWQKKGNIDIGAIQALLIKSAEKGDLTLLKFIIDHGTCLEIRSELSLLTHYFKYYGLENLSEHSELKQAVAHLHVDDIDEPLTRLLALAFSNQPQNHRYWQEELYHHNYTLIDDYCFAINYSIVRFTPSGTPRWNMAMQFLGEWGVMRRRRGLAYENRIFFDAQQVPGVWDYGRQAYRQLHGESNL